MSLQERIQEVIATTGWDNTRLAQAAKVTRASVTFWLDGKTKKIKGETAANIEAASGFSARWIATGKGPKMASNVNPGQAIRSNRGYPLISWVQAGEWSEVCDNFQPGDADEWRQSHKDLGNCGYMLRVAGQSMTAGPDSQFTFPEGILLHVNPDLEAVPGKFVIVRRHGDNTATFKKLVMVDGELFLEAINPAWPNRYIKLQEGDVFCGVVVHAGFDMP